MDTAWGGVALQVAVDYPDLVDHLVFAGGPAFETSGLYHELLAMFESVDPHQVDESSWHEAYRRVAPDPDAWRSVVVKMNQLDKSGVSWPKERLQTLQTPTLLIAGDSDIVRPEHMVEMFRLLGGGVPSRPPRSGSAPIRSRSGHILGA